MKFLLLLFLCISTQASAQIKYDSITLSYFNKSMDHYLIDSLPRTLSKGYFKNYIEDEQAVYIKPASAKAKTMIPILSLVERIKANGTEDVTKCFFPRHSINFYKAGKIVRFVLVCFECDGVRFSDRPAKYFIKSEGVRLKQLAELKKIYSSKGFSQFDYRPRNQ